MSAMVIGDGGFSGIYGAQRVHRESPDSSIFLSGIAGRMGIDEERFRNEIDHWQRNSSYFSLIRINIVVLRCKLFKFRGNIFPVLAHNPWMD